MGTNCTGRGMSHNLALYVLCHCTVSSSIYPVKQHSGRIMQNIAKHCRCSTCPIRQLDRQTVALCHWRSRRWHCHTAPLVHHPSTHEPQRRLLRSTVFVGRCWRLQVDRQARIKTVKKHHRCPLLRLPVPTCTLSTVGPPKLRDLPYLLSIQTVE